MGLALGICCVVATAIGCTGSEGTGDDEGDAATPSAGSAGTPASSSGGSSGGFAGASSAGTGMGVAGGTGGTGAAQCVDSELPLCVDDTNIRACIDGAYETFSCPDFCENGIHFEPGPCDASLNDCACGDPLSPSCADGVSALCFCLAEAGEGCTGLEAYLLYIGCFEKEADLEPVLTCFGENLVGDTPDCNGLANLCIPDTTGASGAGSAGPAGAGAAGGAGGTGGAAP